MVEPGARALIDQVNPVYDPETTVNVDTAQLI
jgi:hypothetical protein